jgi:hypothetical protein
LPLSGQAHFVRKMTIRARHDPLRRARSSRLPGSLTDERE